MFENYFLLALKNIQHRGIRSWLTLLGIIIGIAAVVAFISLGQGLEQAVIGQFSTLSTDRLVITNAETGFGPPGSTTVRKLNSNDLSIIEKVPGVKEAIPRIIRIASVEYNQEVNYEFLSSLPENNEQIDSIYKFFNFKAASGRLINVEDGNGIVLGDEFTKDSKYGKEIRVGSTIKIQGQDFEVVGILERLGSFQFNNAIFILEDDIKNILEIEDEIDLIVAQIENPDNSEQVSEEITRKLRKDRGLKEGEEDFSVETPLQALESISTILNVIRIVVAGIAAISLLIGTIGVTNTMFTSVVERTREIGVMKAIGARRRDILGIFVIESAALGFIGGVIGAFLGIVLSFLVTFIANFSFGTELLSVSLSWPLLGAAVLFSFVLGMVAGIIPAYQASRLHPVEALRK